MTSRFDLRKAGAAIEKQAAKITDLQAKLAMAVEALQELLPWAGEHDEGCSLDPEYGDDEHCNCGLQKDRDKAVKTLALITVKPERDE